MISKALQFTCGLIDQFIKNRLGIVESKVLLNNLIENNGAVPQQNNNKVIISLINIEKETARPFSGWNQQVSDDKFAGVNLTERYNLDILIGANFDNYIETLYFLDEVMLFFQANHCLDSSSYASMPDGIPKLEFEIEKISYHQMQSLWTAMGAKYRPSLVYKMRMVSVQANQSDRFIPAIVQTSVNTIS